MYTIKLLVEAPGFY